MPINYTPTADQIIANLSEQINYLKGQLNNRFVFEGRFDDNAGHALTGGANIPFNTLDDPVGGWDATNHWWVLPFTGRYKVSTAVKADASGMTSDIFVCLNGNQIFTCPDAATGGFHGTGIFNRLLKGKQGDNVSVRPFSSFTTLNDGLGVSNTYLTIEYYSS